MRIWVTITAVTILSGMMPLSISAQTTPTPTPNAAGEIIYIVQPNDTPLGIAATFGITVEALYQLNNLEEDAILLIGQQLVVGRIPPTPTITPTLPTSTPAPTRPPPATVTAVAKPATGLCLIAFDDINGDGIQQPGEPPRADVAFTLFTEEHVILNYITDGFSEPRCFENMPPGTYQITRSKMDAERLTTPGNRGVIIQADTLADLQFGSTTNSEVEIISDFEATAVPEPPPTVLPIGAALEPQPVEEGTQEDGRPTLGLMFFMLALLLVAILLFIIMQFVRTKA